MEEEFRYVLIYFMNYEILIFVSICIIWWMVFLYIVLIYIKVCFNFGFKININLLLFICILLFLFIGVYSSGWFFVFFGEF